MLDVSEAKAQLSALLERVATREVLVIGPGRRPIARSIRFQRPVRRREPGALRGQITIQASTSCPKTSRDPFGRLLIVQALATGFTLVSDDAAVRRYDAAPSPPA